MVILECVKGNPTGELYFKVQSLHGKIVNVWLFENVFNDLKQEGLFFVCDNIISMEMVDSEYSSLTIPIVYENNKLAVYYSYDIDEGIMSIDGIDIIK